MFSTLFYICWFVAQKILSNHVFYCRANPPCESINVKFNMNCSFKTAAMAVKRFFLMTSNLLVIVCLLYVTQEDFPTSHFQFHKIQS